MFLHCLADDGQVIHTVVKRKRVFHIVKFGEKINAFETSDIIACLPDCQIVTARKFDNDRHHIID